MASIVDILLTEARRVGMTARETAVYVATAWKESTLNPNAVGDGGTSYGLFQHHVGGAGGRTQASAQRFLNPATSASERARVFGRMNADSGAEAAAIQRPARAGEYARQVEGIARGILRTGKLPDGTAVAVGAAGGAPNRRTASHLMWVTGDKAGLNPQLLGALAYVGKKVGKRVNVVSGKRSRAEQEALYQKYLNGTGNLAAKPGTSNHESGNAADAYINGTALQSYPGASAAATEAGIGFPVGGEPWHAELVGGAASASSSGAAAAGSSTLQTAGIPGVDVQGSLEWLGENVMFVALVFAAVLIGGALTVGGAWRTFGGTAQGAAQVAIPAARAASKGK